LLSTTVIEARQLLMVDLIEVLSSMNPSVGGCIWRRPILTSEEAPRRALCNLCNLCRTTFARMGRLPWRAVIMNPCSDRFSQPMRLLAHTQCTWTWTSLYSYAMIVQSRGRSIKLIQILSGLTVAVLGTLETRNSNTVTKVIFLVGDDACLGHANSEALHQSIQLSHSLREEYSYLFQDENASEFLVRDDVHVVRDAGDTDALETTQHDMPFGALPLEPLTAGLGITTQAFGHELALGHLLGNVYHQDVLILKLAYANATLGRDFYPPTLALSNTNASLVGGPLYQRLVRFVEIVSSQSQEYDIVGMVWWQGYQDFIETDLRHEYRHNLQQFFNAIRKDWNLPELKLVIGELGGQGTLNASVEEQQFRINQRIVVDSAHDKQHLRFASTHSFVNDSNIHSPSFEAYSVYHNQPLAMLKIGEAFAQQLLELLKSDLLDEFDNNAMAQTGDKEEYEAQVHRLQFIISAVCCMAVLFGSFIGVYATARKQTANCSDEMHEDTDSESIDDEDIDDEDDDKNDLKLDLSKCIQ
jgi:hypothetical protein